MSQRHDQAVGQLAFGEPAGPSVRRALRRGPRLRRTSPPLRPAEPAEQQVPVPRALAEWHDLTVSERLTAWAGLRAWVTWLHDRYELAAEDRLPRCWPEHPGLVEELYALKAWREEIYSAEQPSGQAARYWHAELRQVIHAAGTVYAAGCRTGHRIAPARAAGDHQLQRRWAAADPLAAIPGADLAAGQRAGRTGDPWVSHAEMTAALQDGSARPNGPAGQDFIVCRDGLWTPASSGWIQVSRLGPATLGPGGFSPARTDDSTRRGS
jgi:hypothetical protein